VAFCVAFWHHATILMRPGRLTFSRRARMGLCYLMGALAILMQLFTPNLFAGSSGDRCISTRSSWARRHPCLLPACSYSLG
jgi:hypothetical protein